MAAGIIMASDGLSGSMFETGLPAPYQGGGGLITADLDGDGRRDFLITRVGRIGAVGSSGARLWSKEVDIQLTSKAENEGLPGTHAPGVQAADIDGDGATEVLFLTRDGALNVVDGAPGAERAAVRLPAPPPAAERWEHLVVADFRGRGDRDQRPWVLDARGDVIASYEMADVAPKGWSVKGVEEIFTIHWTGGPEQLAAAKERHTSGDIALFDPLSGAFLWRLDEEADRLYVADVSGDWREEIVVLSGSELHIYENPAPNPDPDRPSLWDEDHYRRSKLTWNYYTP